MRKQAAGIASRRLSQYPTPSAAHIRTPENDERGSGDREFKHAAYRTRLAVGTERLRPVSEVFASLAVHAGSRKWRHSRRGHALLVARGDPHPGASIKPMTSVKGTAPWTFRSKCCGGCCRDGAGKKSSPLSTLGAGQRTNSDRANCRIAARISPATLLVIARTKAAFFPSTSRAGKSLIHSPPRLGRRIDAVDRGLPDVRPRRKRRRIGSSAPAFPGPARRSERARTSRR